MKPANSSVSVLTQICKQIPRNLVPRLASKYGVDKKARSFSPWSHVVSMLFVHLAHSLSLNDVCDTLRNHSGVLTTLRGATPPSRNGLSHANAHRNADLAEALFWEVLRHAQQSHPRFGFDRRYSGLPHRFKRVIYAVDSTTIQLVANCMDWAQHRRRKAAAKCHLQLDLQTFLPHFALVKAARSHDAVVAKELCSPLQKGEIAVFDKAYVDYEHLAALNERGVFWVTRAKTNMCYRTMGQHRPAGGGILRDVRIVLEIDKSKTTYPEPLRLVEADVQINGELKRMTFITNNMQWASSSICDLYRCRWGIEVFFKQIKQVLQLADFLGHNENAVRWQVWMALLAYLLLRLISYLGRWKGSFSRLFTLLRGVLFSRLNLFSVLESCGTARGSPRLTANPAQAYLPGFAIG